MSPYVQTLIKDEFEFSDSPSTSINKRKQSQANQILFEFHELLTELYELSSHLRAFIHCLWEYVCTSVSRQYLYLYLLIYLIYSKYI